MTRDFWTGIKNAVALSLVIYLAIVIALLEWWEP